MEWWQTLFDAKYYKTYIDITGPESTKRQVDFLIKNLRPSKKDTILDLACGAGRHSLEFAKKGFGVVGLDYSIYLLNVAKKAAKKERLKNIKFVRGDMRDLQFKKEFDIALSLFTSFGYFYDEADHVKVLHGIHAALKNKGVFFLDIKNPVHAIQTIKERGAIDKKTGFLKQATTNRLSNGLLVKGEDWYDPDNSRWISRISWREGGKQNAYVSSVRLFTKEEITKMLKAAGFVPKKFWGGYSGNAFNAKGSPRILVRAIKNP